MSSATSEQFLEQFKDTIRHALNCGHDAAIPTPDPSYRQAIADVVDEFRRSGWLLSVQHGENRERIIVQRAAVRR